jgi:transcriptional regulator EpsA
MRTQSAESLKQRSLRSVESANGAEEFDLQSVNPALMEASHLESLVLNLDASLRVHARTHFFNWTQGLLQSLIPHSVLICALRSGEPMSFRVDCFSTLVPDADIFGGLLLRDASGTPTLIRKWKEGEHLPVVCNVKEVGALSDGEFARELSRIGATRLVVHGMLDADGEVSGFFIFGCSEAATGPSQSYLLQLVVPFLHAAWIRSQTHESNGPSRSAPVKVRVLTGREREVLRWIYMGKSNSEIGAILEISPLTVKNHVQNILRKLNVVNRAQAVGKALDARIITP